MNLQLLKNIILGYIDDTFGQKCILCALGTSYTAPVIVMY